MLAAIPPYRQSYEPDGRRNRKSAKKPQQRDGRATAVEQTFLAETLGMKQRIEPVPPNISMLPCLRREAKNRPYRFNGKDDPRAQADEAAPSERAEEAPLHDVHGTECIVQLTNG